MNLNYKILYLGDQADFIAIQNHDGTYEVVKDRVNGKHGYNITPEHFKYIISNYDRPVVIHHSYVMS